MNARLGPATRRDRLVGRLGILSLGIPIAAGFAVVGVGAVAAISYPGKSTTGSATTASGTSQNSGSAVGGSTTSVLGGAVAPVAGRGSAHVSSGSS